MRTVYTVAGQYRSPSGREGDGEPDHFGTFDTLEEAQKYLRDQGYLWDLKGWHKDRWVATIYTEKEQATE